MYRTELPACSWGATQKLIQLVRESQPHERAMRLTMAERQGRKRHGPDQTIAKLRDTDAILAAGASVGRICQMLDVSEKTYDRCRN